MSENNISPAPQTLEIFVKVLNVPNKENIGRKLAGLIKGRLFTSRFRVEPDPVPPGVALTTAKVFFDDPTFAPTCAARLEASTFFGAILRFTCVRVVEGYFTDLTSHEVEILVHKRAAGERMPSPSSSRHRRRLKRRTLSTTADVGQSVKFAPSETSAVSVSSSAGLPVVEANVELAPFAHNGEAAPEINRSVLPVPGLSTDKKAESDQREEFELDSVDLSEIIERPWPTQILERKKWLKINISHFESPSSFLRLRENDEDFVRLTTNLKTFCSKDESVFTEQELAKIIEGFF